nr:hypothetical protein [Tanacetum cinerariifolium]
FFPRAEQERLKREYHSIRQTNTEASTKFMQRFLRLAGFLGAAAGTAEEQAKNFQLLMLLATMRSSMRGMMMTLSDQASVSSQCRRILVEIPHRSIFILGLNALISKSPVHLRKQQLPVDAENWISHMEKIFDVMGCEDAFKTRLAVYKFEGDALAWWKASKQAKGGDVWLITVTWADFKELFFLQFFPRAELERLKREYHSIRQTNTETSMESTLNHLMCMPFTDVAQVANAARNYEILYERDDDDAERPDKRRVVIGISRPLNRVVTGTTVIIMTVIDQTGEAVVTTTVATTTTLATTTVSSSPGVPLRATPTRSALHVDADTQESVVELLVPASSVAKLAICRRIARRTQLRVHLVRLIRSQVHRVAFSSSLKIMLLRLQVPSPVYYLSMDM